ncbi:50S ribosomal protein L17 [Candidatus Roizmanbacteria bacterium]|nr:50S ribosomal protein L17 [Candidatus Roizmanbacteria bacterium]
MWHAVKKLKFKQGQDAGEMLLRKLAANFLEHGRMITTLKRAKAVGQVIDRLSEKAKEVNEANKNYILKQMGPGRALSILFKEIGPVIKEKKGSYVRITRMGLRESDSAEMARVEWVYPIVKEVAKSPPKPKKVTSTATKKP